MKRKTLRRLTLQPLTSRQLMAADFGLETKLADAADAKAKIDTAPTAIVSTLNTSAMEAKQNEVANSGIVKDPTDGGKIEDSITLDERTRSGGSVGQEGFHVTMHTSTPDSPITIEFESEDGTTGSLTLPEGYALHQETSKYAERLVVRSIDRSVVLIIEDGEIVHSKKGSGIDGQEQLENGESVSTYVASGGVETDEMTFHENETPAPSDAETEDDEELSWGSPSAEDTEESNNEEIEYAWDDSSDETEGDSGSGEEDDDSEEDESEEGDGSETDAGGDTEDGEADGSGADEPSVGLTEDPDAGGGDDDDPQADSGIDPKNGGDRDPEESWESGYGMELAAPMKGPSGSSGQSGSITNPGDGTVDLFNDPNNKLPAEIVDLLITGGLGDPIK